MISKTGSNERKCAGQLVHHVCMVFFLLTFLVAAQNTSATVSGNEPVAMVEHIVSGPDDVSNFDYLYPGRVIDLGTDGTLSLIYFQTCLREEILGGRVTIRENASDIRGSVRLRRVSAGCAIDDRRNDSHGHRTSAAMVFRGQAPIEIIDHLMPRFTLCSPAEWFSIAELPSALEILRIGTVGSSFDLRAHALFLDPGKTYRVGTNNGHTIIRTAPDADKTIGSRAINLRHKITDKRADGIP